MPEWAPAAEIAPGRTVRLRGARVLDVAYDSRLHVRVSIHPDVFDLVIEGDCTLATKDAQHAFSATRFAELGPLLELVGKQAMKLQITNDGAFVLVVDEAGTLTAPPAGEWESWNLVGPHGLSLIGAPGGVHRFGPITTEELCRRISETMAWCGTRPNASDPKSGLRSPELRPRPIAACGGPGAPDPRRQEHVREARVDALAEARRKLLGGGTVSGVSGPLNLRGGRILLQAPDDNLTDGASEAASEGFLNIDEEPPWDTWLCYSPPEGQKSSPNNGYLVSYVPAVFVPLVQHGIDVNVVGCMLWPQDDGSRLSQQLKELGLLR